MEGNDGIRGRIADFVIVLLARGLHILPTVTARHAP
jgi:hypothetical protein